MSRVYVEQADVWVRVQRNPRAKYVSLRIDPRDGEAVLVLPRRASLAQGKRFAECKALWLVRHLAALPPRIRFKDGAWVPLLGVPHRVYHDRRANGAIRREGGLIIVPGAAATVASRVELWLKCEAGREIGTRVDSVLPRIGRRVSRIVLTDPRTRWGSCSPNGSIALSWRLIFAPEPVLDYVVAHEVAHLKELNHGPRFWRLVDALCPFTEAAEDWLRRYGQSLHRYG